ncbi:MAG: SRPBCC family protein [Intrasporangium sp.]|uniref:SRPBCC family protein n=1 Tax=Intrasporangium sp. TaxID=1925024 RepID=UPI003F7E7BA7
MQLVNEFTVRAGAEAAFATLSDLERVVTCIPGATFDGRDGANYHGRVGLRIGPVGLNLASTATVVECDEVARRLVVRGVARDRTGQGGANALVTMTVGEEADDETQVRVVTDLDLSGRVAQFGGAAIKQVNRRIVAQFIRELDALLSGEGRDTPDASPAPRPLPHAAQSHCSASALERWAGPVAATAAAGVLLGAAIVRALRRGTVPQPR